MTDLHSLTHQLFGTYDDTPTRVTLTPEQDTDNTLRNFTRSLFATTNQGDAE